MNAGVAPPPDRRRRRTRRQRQAADAPIRAGAVRRSDRRRLPQPDRTGRSRSAGDAAGVSRDRPAAAPPERHRLAGRTAGGSRLPHRRREVAADADPLRPNQLIIFTIASIIGVAAMVFGYMQVPTLLGVGRYHRHAATAGHRRAVPVRQCHLPRRAGRQGHRGRADRRRAPKRRSRWTHHRRSPRTCRPTCAACPRSASSTSTCVPRTDSGPYLQDGSVIARDQHHDPAAGRPDARSGRASWSTASPRTSCPICSTSRSRRSTAPGYDLGSLIDSGVDASPATSTSVSDQRAVLIDDSGPLLDSQAQTTDSIRPWARSLAGVTGQLAQQRSRRYARCCERGPGSARRGFAAAQPDQADAAGAAGEPHHRRPDPGDLQPVARTVAGVAAAVRRGSAVLRSAEEQPDRSALGRLRAADRRPAAVHGRLPAAVAVAFTRPTQPSSTPPTACTASCRRTRRSACAVRATTRAWATPASGHRRWRSATTSLSSRWPSGSTRSVRIPFDPNIVAQGVPARRPRRRPTNGSSRRSRAPRCRRARCHRERLRAGRARRSRGHLCRHPGRPIR